MTFYRFAFTALPVTILTACASVGVNDTPLHNSEKAGEIQQVNEAFVTDFPEVSLNQIAQNVTKDVFKSGDIADVSVYNVEELTQTYVVDRSGDISFPLIGRIKVAGLSTTQLQEILTERYGAEYLRAPSINVKLEAQDLGRVVVDGAVNKPGVFDVNDIITLSEAVALAEGLNTEDTNGSSVFVIRAINGERKIKEVDLRQIRKLGVSDTQIIPGDIVFVEDTTGRVIFREFLRTVPLLNTAAIIATR
jgi:polysaccharide export outer membrane protein